MEVETWKVQILVRMISRGLIAAAALAMPLHGLAAENIEADLKQIAGALQDAGYKAKIDKHDDETFITSATGGYKFLVLVYGCDDKQKNCKSAQF